jgi:hypothetical protein
MRLLKALSATYGWMPEMLRTLATLYCKHWVTEVPVCYELEGSRKSIPTPESLVRRKVDLAGGSCPQEPPPHCPGRQIPPPDTALWETN